MKIGKLGLPIIENVSYLQDPSMFSDYYCRLSNLYDELIEKNNIAKKLIASLKNNPAVQALSGNSISEGFGYRLFHIDKLAKWYLWYANQEGETLAESALNTFLNSSEIQAISALWILGVQLSQEVELFDGLKIVPTNQMVDSKDKALFQQTHYGMIFQMPIPQAAIVSSYRTPKVLDNTLTNSQYDEFNRTQQKMFIIAKLANLLHGISCFPYIEASYVPDSVPFGPFNDSSKVILRDDVMNFQSRSLTDNALYDLKKIYNAFNSMQPNEKERWLRIIDRLSRAKRRLDIADKILELGIALEMMLLDNNPNHEQLFLTFKLRGSWLISADNDERLENYNLFDDIYTYRSQVAHSGQFKKRKGKKIEKLQENFYKYQTVAEKTGRFLLLNGKPDWKKLILGCENHA